MVFGSDSCVYARPATSGAPVPLLRARARERRGNDCATATENVIGAAPRGSEGLRPHTR